MGRGSYARRAVEHVRGLSSGAPLDPALRVTLHLHPDRVVAGVPVLESLRRSGIYRSQFETGTSNGGLTAHPGGDRWRWESRLFGGAYDNAPARVRPVYGSLNHRRRRNGGSARFGSAYFVLRQETLQRSTFCYPDSAFEPVDVGVADRCGLIELAETDEQDLLDDYVEAQVHGGIDLAHDVEILVLDPCFAGTEVEGLARALACPVSWHAGFALDVAEVAGRPGFRGPPAVDLAAQLVTDGHLAANGVLDPVTVGRAAQTGDTQTVKHLWHHLARFGRPRDGPATQLAITLT